MTAVQIEHARGSDVVVVGHRDHEGLAVLYKRDVRDETGSHYRRCLIWHRAFRVTLEARARLPGREVH